MNLNRRNITKGQRAVIAAQGGDLLQITQRDLARLTGVSQSRLAYAKTVLDFAADLVAAVVAGARPLDAAYAEARARKAAGESEDARTATLAEAAPDLAELMIDDAQAVSAGRRARPSTALPPTSAPSSAHGWV